MVERTLGVKDFVEGFKEKWIENLTVTVTELILSVSIHSGLVLGF